MECKVCTRNANESGYCPRCELEWAKEDILRLGRGLQDLMAGFLDLSVPVQVLKDNAKGPRDWFSVKDLEINLLFFDRFAFTLIQQIGEYLGVDIQQEWCDNREEVQA